MKIFRSLLLLSLVALAAFTPSCSKKQDPAPVVGSLRLALTYPANYANLRYYLYTETGWANSLGPLREGQLYNDLIIQDLNAGNYVFSIQGIGPKSVQVTAGQTNAFTFSF